jgi:hypothetical protein
MTYLAVHQEIGRLSIGLWRLCVYFQTLRRTDNRHVPFVKLDAQLTAIYICCRDIVLIT